EKKLKDAGIRIIFKITNERVDILRIVYVLSIEKRSDDFVFKIAHNRNNTLRKLPKDKFVDHIKRSENWARYKKK
ncbi:hypothetical protein G7A79_25215, partial [Coprococcus sp. MSK.21.13]|nr:hypothetical protein [Coprococcus sp. MSK.21.13]